MSDISIYKQRMLDSYSPALQRIYEFQGIVDAEYPEFDLFAENLQDVLNDAYLSTMGEDRVYEWETRLGLPHDTSLPLQSRRNVIMAHIFQKNKLNTETLDFLVDTFTQGHAEYKIKDSTLFIEFYPHIDSVYKLKTFVNEIMNRKPAHIGYMVSQVNDCGNNGENTLSVSAISTQGVTYNCYPNITFKLNAIGNLRMAPTATYNETFEVFDNLEVVE